MRINIDHVSKSFNQKPVLEHITLSIEQGHIVSLLGPSGSGKSTLVRLILGAIPADDGTIQFDDVKIPDLQVLGKIGYMPQNDALYTDLNGEDNLRFFGQLHGLKKNLLNKRIEEVLTLTDLNHDRKKLAGNYSGGMKKRLSLAAALLHEPEVLLLDEPTVGIDPLLKRSIWNGFLALKQQGCTILVTTHVMDEVTECDKAALIYGGRMIHYDSVEGLLSRTISGKIEELFLVAAETENKGRTEA